ncbi:MAG TPA: hypothetical protein VL595_37155 [Pseudonocardia sp.]|jgi:hypothetical protein|nr:hypothetical protein [Pseudonocardia sp.]
MHIAWGSLLIVFMVSFAAAVAVVVLVSFALVALSGPADAESGTALAVPASSRAIAGICLTAAGLIVLYGLYVIVAA